MSTEAQPHRKTDPRPTRGFKKSAEYLPCGVIQGFVLYHIFIQEDFEGIDPDFNWRLTPVPLLKPHGLLQNLLEQGIEVLVADAFPIVHLLRKQKQKGKWFLYSPDFSVDFFFSRQLFPPHRLPAAWGKSKNDKEKEKRIRHLHHLQS